jgi:hypothetical protein
MPKNLKYLSWSAISCFEESPSKWYKLYILGEKTPDNPFMEFGSKFAKSIEDKNCEVQELENSLSSKREQKMYFQLTPELGLVGYIDAYNEDTKKVIDEVKTGMKEWTQQRADDHRQITIYALLNNLINGVYPEDTVFNLHWVKTRFINKNEIGLVFPHQYLKFETKRTTGQIMYMKDYIISIHKKMVQYYLENKQPSLLNEIT